MTYIYKDRHQKTTTNHSYSKKNEKIEGLIYILIDIIIYFLNISHVLALDIRNGRYILVYNGLEFN